VLFIFFFSSVHCNSEYYKEVSNLITKSKRKKFQVLLYFHESFYFRVLFITFTFSYQYHSVKILQMIISFHPFFLNSFWAECLFKCKCM